MCPTTFKNIWMAMRVGYARVSTIDQNPELQLEALRRAGCEKVCNRCSAPTLSAAF